VGPGLLVVSLEQAVAAPLCSRRLADWGARVVKIEPPGGDFARRYDHVVRGQSAYFVWLNRGKESICLDLRSRDDLRLLTAMTQRADVLLHNLRPGALAGVGIDLSRWRRSNPRLITCSISGYGASGPYAGRKAYDLLVQAESGLASITGSAAEPSRVGISVVDIAAGLTAYEAILEALLRRERTDSGEHVEVSLFDAITEWMTVPLLHARYAEAPRRVGLMHPSIAPYGAVACRDGRQVLLAVQNEREWVSLCTDVLGKPELAVDARYRDNTLRVANRSTLDAMLAQTFGMHSSEEMCRALDAASVAYGVINHLDGVLKHPMLRTVDIQTPAGPIPIPAPAARHAGANPAMGPVPEFNQHGSALRAEFAPASAATAHLER
jgi:crotonobetainyl-CoA:carnitine CoA-transferase CaiB-like acyl-CoA transferase